MSDPLKHECGIALIRLLKPLEYYQEKHGSILYGFNKLFLLMEKQHNRGQDGAGIGCVKLDMPAGQPYMFRDRDTSSNALTAIIQKHLQKFRELTDKKIIDLNNPQTVKKHWKFGSEVLLGHLRYATSNNYGSSGCHPYVRRSNWPTRNLMLAGNFNMTNVDELHQELISRGQHPIFGTDTQAILEAIGYELDEEHSRIYREMRDANTPSDQIPQIISEKLDLVDIFSKATASWDGGYTIAGMIGNGDAFALRDPLGIRPGFYYQDEEVVAIASERVPLMTIFNLSKDQIQEIKPGHVVVIKKSGNLYEAPFKEAQSAQYCSFERIYFSRGNDPDIYKERKALGASLAKPILKTVDNDLENTVFGYIPNTAESAYYGLMDELRLLRRREVKDQILKASQDNRLSPELLDRLITQGWPRREKVAIKDIKLRTFISQEDNRLQLASHVYDITYGVIGSNDNLVCIDDSIIRGTTLKQSILRILSRTHPKKIVIASTAPQIRYPDCYGIDMSEMGKFVAFQATVKLLEERGEAALIADVYEKCCAQANTPSHAMQNFVKSIYDPFSPEEISKKIVEIVFPKADGWKGVVEIVFQNVESLHKCLIPNCGDWYFTGNYPTAGGYKVLNQSFINYFEKKKGRSY